MTNSRDFSSRHRDIGFGAIAISAVIIVSIGGQLATYPNLAPWYAGLVKPSFNPPNWVFAPAWTVLYLLVAFAAWRVLRLPPSLARRSALLLFAIQLALNAAWSWMFFAAQISRRICGHTVPQCAHLAAADAWRGKPPLGQHRRRGLGKGGMPRHLL